MRILLVEDEVDLAQALASALRQNQAVVDVAGSLREAEDAALSAQHDVIVLDRGLPDGDGLSLVAFLRQNDIPAAVLVLTAMTDVAERVLSLDGGADDIQSNALDTHISRLRSKLDKAGAQVEIHAIRGVGYLICAARPAA